MPDVKPVTPKGGENILTKKLGPLAGWQWGLVIVGGAVLGYFLIKQFGQSSQAASTASSPDSGLGLAIDPTTGLPYAVEGLVPSGGLAGASGGTQGATGPTGPAGPAGPAGASTRTYTTTGHENTDQLAAFFGYTPAQFGALPDVWSAIVGKTGSWAKVPAGETLTLPLGPLASVPIPQPGPLQGSPVPRPPQPPTMPRRSIKVAAWPQPFSSLSDIASREGMTLASLERLNPQITNPNLIHPGETVYLS